MVHRLCGPWIRILILSSWVSCWKYWFLRQQFRFVIRMSSTVLEVCKCCFRCWSVWMARKVLISACSLHRRLLLLTTRIWQSGRCYLQATSQVHRSSPERSTIYFNFSEKFFLKVCLSCHLWNKNRCWISTMSPH